MIQTHRYFALDTSHLNALAKDKFFRGNPERREAAHAFEKRLFDSGAILTFCFHHIEEMLRHGDDAVVRDRVAYLRSIPLLAWVKPAIDSSQVGSIVDIMAREASVAFNSPNASCREIRKAVAPSLFKIGDGEELMAAYHPCLSEFVAMARRRDQRIKAVAAIAHLSDNKTISDHRVSALLSNGLPSEAALERRFRSLETSLAAEIRDRGDTKLEAPEIVATGFVNELRRALAEARATARDGTDIVPQILRQQGIDVNEELDNMTIGDAGVIAQFRKALRQATDLLGLEWLAAMSRISSEQLPSWSIQRALTEQRQDAPRRAGSEITDRYLACLTPYAHATYVDKRTLENFRRALSKNPPLNLIVNEVCRAASYSAIGFGRSVVSAKS